jgi:hypothetical protein
LVRSMLGRACHLTFVGEIGSTIWLCHGLAGWPYFLLPNDKRHLISDKPRCLPL